MNGSGEHKRGASNENDEEYAARETQVSAQRRVQGTKYKNANVKVKRVAGEKWELKRELVEAKLDGTIFSPFYKVTVNPIYNYEVQGSPN